MNSPEDRLAALEARVERLSVDLQRLRDYIDKEDLNAALNKIRYITEKALSDLLGKKEVSAHGGKPQLESLIPPLVKNGILPGPIEALVRTIQANTNLGSHFNPQPPTSSNLSLSRDALAGFLEWCEEQRQPGDQGPPSLPVGPVRTSVSPAPAPGTVAGPRRRRMPWGWILSAASFLVVLGLGLAGWNMASHPPPLPGPADPPAIPKPDLPPDPAWLLGLDPYHRECSEAKQLAEEERGFLLPLRLEAHEGDGRAFGAIDSEELADQLLRGLTLKEGNKLRRVLVVGPAGCGKSPLARRIRRETCDRYPTFFVDLNEMARVDPPPKRAEDFLLHCLVARKLGLKGPPDQDRALAILQESPWLLVLDGMDELAPAYRDAVVDAVNAMMAKHPSMRLVALGRPPVIGRPDYGLNIESRVLIPPLSTVKARDYVRRVLGQAGLEEARFWAALAQARLDSTARDSFGAEHYLYLGCFRDIQAMVKVVGSVNLMPNERTLAGIYLRFVLHLLDRESRVLPKDFSLGATVMVGIVDRMMQARMQADMAEGGYQGKARMPWLDEAACLAALKDAGTRIPAEGSGFVCERILSSLFRLERQDDLGRRFEDQSLADFFIARQINHEMERDGLDCGDLARFLQYFRDSDVLAFLAGMPAGQRCLQEELRLICDGREELDRVSRDALLKRLRQGLPGPPLRAMILARAREADEEAGECVAGLLDDLGLPPAAPEETGEDASGDGG